jgi:hypothetical protein
MWVVDSTPVECGRSRETAKRSELAGWAQYAYCASHSRYFWGLRLHLVCTLHGLPVVVALTGAKADERQVLLDLLATEPHLVAARPGQVLIADRHYYGGQFERMLAGLGLRLLRPARKGEAERAGAQLFKRCASSSRCVNHSALIYVDWLGDLGSRWGLVALSRPSAGGCTSPVGGIGAGGARRAGGGRRG